MAVVKANAYGHGAVAGRPRRARRRRDWLGVADLDEALALRAAGIDAPILAWLHDPDADFAAADRRAASSSASRALEQLERAACRRRPARPACTSRSTPGSAATASPEDEWHARRRARRRARARRPRSRASGVFSHLANTSRDDGRRAARASSSAALAAAADAGLRPRAAAPRLVRAGASATRGALRPRAHRHRHLRAHAVRRRHDLRRPRPDARR